MSHLPQSSASSLARSPFRRRPRCPSNAFAPLRVEEDKVIKRSLLIGARHRARGQVLVIFVGGFLGIIAMTAVVVDGGNAMAQQRGTQNGADAAAQAGTVVLAQRLMGAAVPA